MTARECVGGEIFVRNTRQEDFREIIEMTEQVYPGRKPWTREQLSSHLEMFPEGQLVAVLEESGRVVGMAASLVITWDDYDAQEAWRDLTDRGMFTNHDPDGRTLYGAEVMVHPDFRRRGIGRKLYAARRELVKGLELLRIRAGARLRDYHRWADRLSPEDYVRKIIDGELSDPTLSFQLSEGFHVLQVVTGYLPRDPESLGYAALIEWLNPEQATEEDYARVRRFHHGR
jgi:ribosomal protein S18 acetylase RimI-like enzyme